MTEKEQQLKKLYELKKMQDRQCRAQEKVDYLNEQMAQIREQAADTELMPLKKTDHAQDLTERFKEYNVAHRAQTFLVVTVVLLLSLLAVCVLCGMILVDNDMFLLENGSILAGTVDPEEPMESFNTPTFGLVLGVVLMGICYLVVTYLPAELLMPESWVGFGIRAVAAMLLVGCTVFVCLALYKLEPYYLVLPIGGIVLSIVLRIATRVSFDRDQSWLTQRQQAEIQRAVQLDERNKKMNVQIKQDAKTYSLAERQPEIDRIQGQIASTQTRMLLLDLQMRTLNVLHESYFPALPRILELLESNQATDISHALRLYDQEKDAYAKQEAADKRRTAEMVALYNLYGGIRRQAAEEANRQMMASWNLELNQLQTERDIRDKLKEIRDREFYRK